MAINKISCPNIEKVLENSDVQATTVMDINMTSAYEESVAAAQHVEEVEKELQEKSEAVTLETPEAPEVKSDNIYTKKITLDESVDEFNLSTAKNSEDEYDDYLDYDMFDFCYGIVTAEEWPKIKNPLDHPIRKFLYTGSDDYMKTNSNKGISQVSTDYNGNIVVYSDNAADFDDVIAVCKHYKIRVSNPTPRKSNGARWKFNLTIFVPVNDNGYPMMAEDFFAEQGLSLADVMEDYKSGNTTGNWGKTYERKAEKDRKEAETFVNDRAVRAVYDKWFDKAANSNDPLEDFVKGMFNELTDKGLTFSKVKLKREFMDAFDDDFED